MLKTVGNWWRKTDTGPDEQTNNYEVLPFQIRIVIVDELSIHVLFCPDLQIFALALPHRTTLFLYTGFLIKLQYMAKISVNKSLEQGEQEISTLQTIL